MRRYIFERIIAMVITMFIIMTLAFLLIRLMPGNLYDVLLGGKDNLFVTQQMIDTINAKYHFDEPIIIQYGYYLKDIFHGDFGSSLSISPGVTVLEVIKEKVPVTLMINFIALFVAIPIGIFLGAIAAIKKNTWIDHFVSFLVVLFISVPSFVFATVMQYTLAFKLDLFPLIYNPTLDTGFLVFSSMILPIMALMFAPIANIARYLRAELGEIMNSEFLLLARTKGLTFYQSVIRHGLRNSMVPLVTIIMPLFVTLIGGSLVIENIFTIPGMGSLLVKSIKDKDDYLTLSTLLFYAFISVLLLSLIHI